MGEKRVMSNPRRSNVRVVPNPGFVGGGLPAEDIWGTEDGDEFGTEDGDHIEVES
jgi:hypothetical protein